MKDKLIFSQVLNYSFIDIAQESVERVVSYYRDDVSYSNPLKVTIYTNGGNDESMLFDVIINVYTDNDISEKDFNYIKNMFEILYMNFVLMAVIADYEAQEKFKDNFIKFVYSGNDASKSLQKILKDCGINFSNN